MPEYSRIFKIKSDNWIFFKVEHSRIFQNLLGYSAKFRNIENSIKLQQL